VTWKGRSRAAVLEASEPDRPIGTALGLGIDPSSSVVNRTRLQLTTPLFLT
jgi:hypothetical protein